MFMAHPVLLHLKSKEHRKNIRNYENNLCRDGCVNIITSISKYKNIGLQSYINDIIYLPHV